MAQNGLKGLANWRGGFMMKGEDEICSLKACSTDYLYEIKSREGKQLIELDVSDFIWLGNALFVRLFTQCYGISKLLGKFLFEFNYFLELQKWFYKDPSLKNSNRKVFSIRST